MNTTVDLGPPGPDNDFGYGRLDLLAAYEWLQETTDPTPTVNQADLSVAKVDAEDPVAVVATIVYTVTVHNAGPDAAADVTARDTLPPEVSYSAASGDGWTCAHNEGEVTCTRPGLGIGAAPSIVITVTAPSSAAVITNTVMATSSAGDPSPANNLATEQTSIALPPSHRIYLPLMLQ